MLSGRSDFPRPLCPSPPSTCTCACFTPQEVPPAVWPVTLELSVAETTEVGEGPGSAGRKSGAAQPCESGLGPHRVPGCLWQWQWQWPGVWLHAGRRLGCVLAFAGLWPVGSCQHLAGRCCEPSQSVPLPRGPQLSLEERVCGAVTSSRQNSPCRLLAAADSDPGTALDDPGWVVCFI